MVFFHQIVEYCESDCDQHNKILFFNVGERTLRDGVPQISKEIGHNF